MSAPAGGGRELRRIDPRGLETGPEAPLRLRRALPGEAGATPGDPLAASIAAHGILQPPLAAGGDGGPLLVVDGFRRIAAARAAEIREIDIIVLPAGAGAAEIAALRLATVPLGLPLSELEQIAALDRLCRFAGWTAEDVPGDAAALFGRALSPDHAARLLGLLDLDGDVLALLHEGALSAGDLLRLLDHPRLDAAGAAAAARLLGEARLNAGRRREAVGLMLDLADAGPGALAAALGGIEADGRPLPTALRRAARPGLERDLARFAETAREIGLPSAGAIHPPTDLEGGAFAVELRVRRAETLRVAIGKLAAALEDGRIDRLLDILKGKEDGGGSAVG